MRKMRKSFSSCWGCLTFVTSMFAWVSEPLWSLRVRFLLVRQVHLYTVHC